MKEFHRKDSSKLSISNELELTGLHQLSVPLESWAAAHAPVLNSICEVKVCTVVERPIA